MNIDHVINNLMYLVEMNNAQSQTPSSTTNNINMNRGNLVKQPFDNKKEIKLINPANRLLQQPPSNNNGKQLQQQQPQPQPFTSRAAANTMTNFNKGRM